MEETQKLPQHKATLFPASGDRLGVATILTKSGVSLLGSCTRRGSQGPQEHPHRVTSVTESWKTSEAAVTTCLPGHGAMQSFIRAFHIEHPLPVHPFRGVGGLQALRFPCAFPVLSKHAPGHQTN